MFFTTNPDITVSVVAANSQNLFPGIKKSMTIDQTKKE